MTVATPAPAQPRDQVARLLSALRQVKLLWRDVTRDWLPGGVSGFGVLHLLDQQGAMRVSDLAVCGHVGVSTMSRHVAELTAAGLIDRELAPEDARTHLVRLTGDGRAELERARGAVLDRLAPALDGWTENDIADLERLLDRLAHGLTAAHDGAAPEGTR